MFSKKSAEPHGSPLTGNPGQGMTGRSNSSFSVLGSDLSITGDLNASADLHVDGNVEGDITCSNLVQGETSTVTGNIEAESARFAGTVQGSIKARELVILKTARITGDVFYDALTIEQGAQVEGRFAHRDSRVDRKVEEPADGKPELTVAS